MEFFNTADIEVLSRVGHKPFRKGDLQNERDAQLIKEGPLAKTDYWSDELKKRLPNFEIKKNHHWQRSGNFSHYTWVKICKHQDAEKDIYFTIGVDGEEKCLVYKLDYQFDGSSRLSVTQKQICEKQKNASGAGWRYIEPKAFSTYTWERLVDEVVEFIIKNESKYDDMIRQACCRNARICWNDFAWQYPSGEAGKSGLADSYEREYGYGNEEWILDFSKLIDGYHYGFLEPVRHAKDDYIGGVYDLLLWSVDSRTAKRYVIANLRNVMIIKESEAHTAYDTYSKRGWLSQMRAQIKAIGGNIPSFEDSFGVNLFNIRFRPCDVDFMDYAEVLKGHSICRQAHYVLTKQANDVKILLSSIQNNTYQFAGNKRSAPPLSTVPTSYVRLARSVEIQHQHTDVSHRLIAFLEVKFGADNVAQENNIGARRIDAVARTPDGDIFYEIKTYPSLRVSIREAVGQLLEYAFYPDQQNASRLVVVGVGDENSLEGQDVAKYIEQLRTVLSIPISLLVYNLDTQKFSREI